MARPLRIQYPGAFYHVMCRGNKGSNIFIDNTDRSRFLFLLAESLETYSVILYAYVMMNNHFHIVVQTLRPNLSEFMRRFNICYTGWFNHHHGTNGHLYQGRYKALLVDADNYLLELSRYVHLNPIRNDKLRPGDYRMSWRTLQEYQWSSLPGYLRDDKTKTHICYDMILGMIGGRKAYQRFIIDGLRNDLESPYVHVKYQTILGSDSFVRRVKGRLPDKGSNREQPVFMKIKRQTVDPEVIIKRVGERLGVSRDKIVGRHNRGIARGITSELLYRYSDLNLRQIGDLLGVDYSSIHKTRCRLQKQMSEQKHVARIYEELETTINDELSNVEI
ncbi:transposase [candidate division WOR-3 bacterium]|nr:transposase [candidate division WOR-3 bacterium]